MRLTDPRLVDAAHPGLVGTGVSASVNSWVWCVGSAGVEVPGRQLSVPCWAPVVADMMLSTHARACACSFHGWISTTYKEGCVVCALTFFTREKMAKKIGT